MFFIVLNTSLQLENIFVDSEFPSDISQLSTSFSPSNALTSSLVIFFIFCKLSQALDDECEDDVDEEAGVTNQL